MTQLQPVLGYFDTIADAQQAIQLLLSRGFTSDTVELSMPTRLLTNNDDKNQSSSIESSSSGRFVCSLFNNQAKVPSRPGILVTVQTQSAAEARQVADLLNTAGAADADGRMITIPL